MLIIENTDGAIRRALVLKHNLMTRWLADAGIHSFAHYDRSSTSGGDPSAPTDAALALAFTTPVPNLVALVVAAEAVRTVLLQHLGDAVTENADGAGAHKIVDAVNIALISYATLPPLLPNLAPLPWSLTGGVATYAAVTATHSLVLSINGVRTTVTFAGTENSQSLFHAALNAALPKNTAGGYAQNSGGKTQLVTFGRDGEVSQAFVVSGDADVLVSLGLTAGATFAPIAAVTQPATLTQAEALLTALQAVKEAHLTQTGVHPTNDTVNTSSPAAATDLATSKLMAADLKTYVNAHILSSPGSLMVGLA